MDYGFIKELDATVEEAEARVTEALKGQGFGVLTRIDVSHKFKEKLNVDFRKYIILGACNPGFAHKALQAEENIGLMLPCNVCVYEAGGKTVVSAIKPSAAMGMIHNPALADIAAQVEAALEKVISGL